MGDIRTTIDTYVDLLRAEELSPVTIKHYRGYLQKALTADGGPLAYMASIGGKQWGVAKAALIWYATFTRNRDLEDDIRRMRAPRKLRAAPVQIPDVDTWRRLGTLALREKPPFSCLLWLQLYSGLRIGDLMNILHGEIETAAESGRTTMHQKGPGGKARRDWIPGPLCQGTVVWLAGTSRAPDGRPTWRVLHQLASPSFRCNIEKAKQRVWDWMPKPWHPHTFRHAVPSYLYEMGWPIEDIASITGHESLETLRRTYIHAVSPRRTIAAQMDLLRMLAGSGWEGVTT